MNIRIYQIDLDKDTDRVAFDSYRTDRPVDGSIYEKTFEGETPDNNLEDVYQRFNVAHPAGYTGRSLSVSDVVETVEPDGSRFFYCDSIGFQEIEFTPPVPENAMTVVLCEPGKVARIAEIDGSLKGMQAVVGGFIEAVYPYEDPVALICNEEGKVNRLDLNRGLKDPDGHLYDIVAGTFFVAGCGEEDFISLTEEQQQKYLEQFKYPERLCSVNGRYKMIPYKPSEPSPQKSSDVDLDVG